MCQYCELTKAEYFLFSNSQNEKEAKVCLVENEYEYCKIRYINGSYYIYLAGESSGISKPIFFCPFCGKKLTKMKSDETINK